MSAGTVIALIHLAAGMVAELACKGEVNQLLHVTVVPVVQVVQRIEELERSASLLTAQVMVVGAGPAGVELASTVAERLGSKAHVQLVSAGLCYILSHAHLLPCCEMHSHSEAMQCL